MNEIDNLKRYLTRAGVLYISDEVIDDIKYIHFTYNHENFTISINDEYKMIVLNTEHSFYEETGLYTTDLYSNTYDMEAEVDTIEELLFKVIDYMNKNDFKEYSLTVLDYIEETLEDGIDKHFRINSVHDKNRLDFEYTESEDNYPQDDYELIEYKEGLNEFHRAIFRYNWLENFNKKVKDYNEKDLFIVISTLSGYTYKLINKIWDDEPIDPYVIENATSIAIEESKKFSDNFIEWYSKWNDYFTTEKVKQYIKKKENY